MFITSLTLSLMLSTTGNISQDDDARDLQKLRTCSKVENDLERLVCYDKIFTALPKEKAPVSKSKFGLKKSSAQLNRPKRPTLSNNPQASKDPTTLKTLLDTFLKKDSAINRITVEILSHKKARNGAYIFTMKGGSVWKQSDAMRRPIKKGGFTATISKGDFSNFILKPKEGSWSVRVKRIK